MATAQERYRQWLAHPCFDAATQAELAGLQDRPQEIEDRFYRDLDFGTGGLRGVLGAGTNRMNRYVIRQAASGLAAYIASFGLEAKRRGVVIAHDSRRCSPEFALEAARVLAAAGVKAWLWESLRPTPMLSFAVRELGATAGIVVTASHNPPEYNGFKVYWSDGGQVPPERAAAIKAQMALVDIPAIPLVGEREARAAGLLATVPPTVDRAYYDRLLALVGGPDERRQACRVLFTPLHGSGHWPVRTVLNEARFAVTMVGAQTEPDADFRTVKAPNPEDPAVFALALAQAEHLQPDVILATDPDADRLGVMARDAAGAYRLLTGNQIGALLVDFLLSRAQKEGRLPANGAVLKSVATANLVEPICRQYGVAMIDTHTGFKFIGEKIAEWEETGQHTFLFGFEESYGYLAGAFVRDKDAVMAALLAAEAAAWQKRRGRTLCDALEELWQRHGYYRESLHSVTLPGKDGLAQMAALMQRLREAPPTAFGPLPVARADDYLRGLSRDAATGTETPLALGRADVLHYRFGDGGFVMVRPSGTEPKLKLYVAVKGATAAEADERLAAAEAAARELLAYS